MKDMHVYSVTYGFKQPLKLPPQDAFDWCTDYKPHDLAIMQETGKRKIRKLTSDAIILTETTGTSKKPVTKTKLVRLNRPELSWTNTHISGPNRHSEFIYKIEPHGKNRSRLKFTGLLMCYSIDVLTREKLRKIARDERRADSRAWHYLAAAMEKEMNSRR
jgi:hypothetical protein